MRKQGMSAVYHKNQNAVIGSDVPNFGNLALLYRTEKNVTHQPMSYRWFA
jgi:hypothetical protein